MYANEIGWAGSWADCVNREYIHSVAVYKKYLTKLGELIIFEP